MSRADVAVVVTTVGSPELDELLGSLKRTCRDERPEVVVVDDRPHGGPELSARPSVHEIGARLVRTGGRGPAAATNCGWRAVRTDWVVFLDEGVLLEPGWYADLHRDLEAAGRDVGAIQGRVLVPQPQRHPAGQAPWMAGDLALRRLALVCAGGLGERFPRAYLDEDVELVRTVQRMRWLVARGRRRSVQARR